MSTVSDPPFVKPTSEFDRRTLGKYELLCRLSTGGMSEIFLATQKGLAGFRKIVVLKSILPDIRGEDEFVKMFLEEARTTAAFNHPNIAQVFDLDTDSGMLFLAMEFVQGATLVEMARACRQAKEPIPLGFTLASVRDTALALHYAHTFIDPRGRKQIVIHRDVAEKNIMVSYDGTTKLLDFGIAKALGRRSGSLTSIGMVKGTSGYMSPEQIRGEPLDPRSDVFALGVVLHECLTGMRLFHGKNAEDGMLAALREDVQPPSRLSPDVPAAIDAVTLKALARDRDQRYGTALELARAIEKACPGALWHAEQSGDLVQRFYNERRQQTRDLIENAQRGQEPTGELRLDKVFAAVGGRPQSNIGKAPTPPAGNLVPLPTPRRETAQTVPLRPAGRDIKTVPGVAQRVSGEKPVLPSDETTGSDGRLPVPSAKEVTELHFDADEQAAAFDDEDSAKTIPATSLPVALLAQLRANRAREPEAVPAAAHSPLTEPQPPALRHSNVVLAAVYDPSTEGDTTTSTTGPVQPNSDIVDGPDLGTKTAIDRPFDTRSDDDRFDGSTKTGFILPGGGRGRLILIGLALAAVAIGGTLFALKAGPFGELPSGPQPASKLPGTFPHRAETLPVPEHPHPAEPVPVPGRVEPRIPTADPLPTGAAKKIEVKPEPRPDPKAVRRPLREPTREPAREVVREPVKRKPSEPRNETPVLLGSVSLVVEPPVHVFFAGKDLGTTPLKATLPVGKQTLKFVPSEGPSKTVSVEVKEAGGAARFDLEDL